MSAPKYIRVKDQVYKLAAVQNIPEGEPDPMEWCGEINEAAEIIAGALSHVKFMLSKLSLPADTNTILMRQLDEAQNSSEVITEVNGFVLNWLGNHTRY